MTTSPIVLDSPAVVRESVISPSTLLRLAALTPAVLLVHGFHPFADDAGIYVAGVRKLVDPALYQPDAAFVVSNTHLSLFAHVLAAVVRMSHLPMAAVLLATHLVSIYLFLVAGWWIANSLFKRAAERWFAVGLAAACFTLPAAGTALALMDPYVTSRSFSTPLGLFALAAVIERRWWLAGTFVVMMGLMHPLMAIYAAGLVLFYLALDTGRVRVAALLAGAVVAAAGMMGLMSHRIPVSPAYFATMHRPGRAFLFPTEWKWYEDLGLIAPLTLFGLGALLSKPAGRIRNLCMACLLTGVSSALAAFLFVHPTGPYLLVRLQLLRSFHILYLAGVLMLGGWIARVLAYRESTRWVAYAMLAAAAGGLFCAQRATYPYSSHIEWPGMRSRNPWAQAYRWIRTNTPPDAIFSADPDLGERDGVDMQGFRATAERSLLADNKDQGVAAVVNPLLAEEWMAQRNAQLGIDSLSDMQRLARLRPFGVTWILLPASAATNFPCPYKNLAAKVCRMD